MVNVGKYTNNIPYIEHLRIGNWFFFHPYKWSCLPLKTHLYKPIKSNQNRLSSSLPSLALLLGGSLRCLTKKKHNKGNKVGPYWLHMQFRGLYMGNWGNNPYKLSGVITPFITIVGAHRESIFFLEQLGSVNSSEASWIIRKPIRSTETINNTTTIDGVTLRPEIPMI